MMDSGGSTVTKAGDHHQRIQQMQQQQQQQEIAAQIQLQQQAQNVRQVIEKHDTRAKKDGEDGDDDDDRSADSDDEWLNELESDPALEEIREHRLQQLRQEHLHKLELKSKGHGDYRTISQDEFLPETCAEAAAATDSSKSKRAASEWVVVHFFHDEFIKCKVMDHHLKIVAAKHLECKFLRIEAQKAPFFCSKLKVMTLPTVLVLREGNVVDRLVGFEGIAEDNEWPTRLLQKWLAKSGAIEYKPPSREIEEEMERLGISVEKGSIRRGGVRHYDDDDE
jgi:hypothetical protein